MEIKKEDIETILQSLKKRGCPSVELKVEHGKITILEVTKKKLNK